MSEIIYIIRSDTLNMKSPLIEVGPADYRKSDAVLLLVLEDGGWSLHDPNGPEDDDPLMDGEGRPTQGELRSTLNKIQHKNDA